ncbi:hypothetical protein V6X62_09360 [Spiribacter sp. 218]|uniref:hypothetical protein n=1 Tax=Spiribacter pallidus TaxID=1987936 RepID=UPI00349F541D
MDHKQKLEVYRQLSQMPDHAIEWLAAQERKWDSVSRYTRGSRQVIEYLLYRRDCPRINLALAEYATYIPILRRLFHSSSKALRLAVLSNANVGPGVFSKDTVLYKKDVVSLIENSPEERDLFDCYFCNDNIPRELVADIVERNEPFGFIDDEKLLLIVATLADNPIISHIRDETRLDGYAEYSYYRLNMALLDLYINAPRDIRWAGILADILQKLHIPFLRKEFSIDQVSSWVIESNIEEKKSEETGNILNRFGSSDYYLRHQMAGVIFEDNPWSYRKYFETLPDDSAIRTAYYICCKPSDLFGARVESDGFQYPSFSMEEGFYDEDEDAKEIINKVNEYFSLDGNEFIDCLIRNKAFWRNQAGRDFLNSLAWKKAEDPSSYMDIPNNYRMIEKGMMKLHPEYFEDDPFENVTEEKSDRRLVEDLVSEVKDLRQEITDAVKGSVGERTPQKSSELQWIFRQVEILQGRVLFLILLVALLIGAFAL